MYVSSPRMTLPITSSLMMPFQFSLSSVSSILPVTLAFPSGAVLNMPPKSLPPLFPYPSTTPPLTRIWTLSPPIPHTFGRGGFDPPVLPPNALTWPPFIVIVPPLPHWPQPMPLELPQPVPMASSVPPLIVIFPAPSRSPPPIPAAYAPPTALILPPLIRISL